MKVETRNKFTNEEIEAEIIRVLLDMDTSYKVEDKLISAEIKDIK